MGLWHYNKILIKSSNMLHLFVPSFMGDEIIDKIWIITTMVSWVSSAAELWNERLDLSWGCIIYNRGRLT